MIRHIVWRLFILILLPAFLVPGSFAAETAPAPAASGHLVKHGVIVDFEAWPADGEGQALMEGQLAEIRFRLTEEASGAPVSGITPGVWMDIGEVLQGQPGAEQKSCKDKIALYLKGVVGIRPMIDLNSYYVVVMNQEPSLSIIDPLVSMAGVTSTLGVIPLKGPGADWARSLDEKRLYVSMPTAGQVALVDTDAFKVTASIEAGTAPARVALQPDGRYLWVGNNATASVAFIATGLGHQEIAFSDDSRYAFVSNRDAGTVSIIDVQSQQKLKDLATGPLPISLAYSPLSQALYVADGKAGTITAVDGRDFDVLQRITLKPGLGPLRFTPDGRWALAVNPVENAVYVIDAASNTLVHTLAVSGQPYQVIFSRAFAYVRALGSERVTMINLSSLGEGKAPIVQGFTAGNVAPKLAGDLPLADSIASTSSEAAMLIVNPADNTTYFYMEGMNAPASNYKVYGASARAVTVVDRSLREIEPGLYASKVKIPAAGRYDVAFLLDTPQMLHCFSAEARPNPLIRHDLAALAIEYLQNERRVTAGTTVPLRFKLVDPLTGRSATGLTDVRVMFFRAPGLGRTEVLAEEIGDGTYQASLSLQYPGAYYVHVGVPSNRLGYSDLTYFTLVATKPAAVVTSQETAAGRGAGVAQQPMGP
jgi:YVTN family beta-propeller protein